MWNIRYLKNKTRFALACLVVMQQSLTFAAPLELSVEDSIRLALQSNPAIAIAGKDRESSQWNVDTAKAGKSPSVSLGSSYNLKDGGDLNNSISMNWQLYSGGRVEGQIKQAQLGVTAADLGVEKTRQQVKLDAAAGYYTILENSDMVTVSQETVNSLREHLNMVQAKYEAGTVAKADVLRAEVELANAEQNVTKAQNSYNIAVATLLNTMNMDAGTEVTFKSQFTYEPYGKTLDEALALAKQNRPELLQAKTNIAIADTGVKVAEGSKKPSVSMSASSKLGNSLLPDDGNWSLGLSANWSVFDAGVNNAKIKQAQTSLDKAMLQVKQTSDSIGLEVRESYLSMQEAEKRLATTNVAVGKAQEDLMIAREKYNAGVGTNLDVMDSQLALTQAKTNHVQALYDFNLNKAKLDKAIGMPAEQ